MLTWTPFLPSFPPNLKSTTHDKKWIPKLKSVIYYVSSHYYTLILILLYYRAPDQNEKQETVHTEPEEFIFVFFILSTKLPIFACRFINFACLPLLVSHFPRSAQVGHELSFFPAKGIWFLRSAHRLGRGLVCKQSVDTNELHNLTWFTGLMTKDKFIHMMPQNITLAFLSIGTSCKIP